MLPATTPKVSGLPSTTNGIGCWRQASTDSAMTFRSTEIRSLEVSLYAHHPPERDRSHIAKGEAFPLISTMLVSTVAPHRRLLLAYTHGDIC